MLRWPWKGVQATLIGRKRTGSSVASIKNSRTPNKPARQLALCLHLTSDKGMRLHMSGCEQMASFLEVQDTTVNAVSET